MAATTARKRIGNASPTGGVAFDAAPGTTWTLLATGALNLLIKFERGMPPIEIWHGATGLPAATVDGMSCDWEDASLSITLLAGNSVYYRSSAPSQFTYSTDA